jgi:hypothetical protein
MSETENEYGCVRCQAYHGESDGPVYAEHLTWQSKHGLRRRVVTPVRAQDAADELAERRRQWRAPLRGGSAAREGEPGG